MPGEFMINSILGLFSKQSEDEPAASELLDRAKGSLLGLACGDAVGTTLEFSAPGSFQKLNDMIGGGPFDLKPGEWTDDTSMALCLATSLLEDNGFSAEGQMRRFLKWFEEGYLSSNGKFIDIGRTVRLALVEYRETGDALNGSTDENSAGNGSIMRLCPIPLYYYPNQQLTVKFSAMSSQTTHGAKECLDACRCLGLIIHRALQGDSKEEILSFKGMPEDLCPRIKAVMKGSYARKRKSKIQGSDYVVESLEAALWAFHKSSNYKETILEAVNLGRDADTTGAICGQIAGAYWGKSGIPKQWLNKIVMADKIESLATQLIEAVPNNI
jgi:ADP-ribosyl-[dinitrogen reductase] hydrolase